MPKGPLTEPACNLLQEKKGQKLKFTRITCMAGLYRNFTPPLPPPHPPPTPPVLFARSYPQRLRQWNACLSPILPLEYIKARFCVI